MDIPATQVYEDNDFTPTQRVFHPSQQEGIQDKIQIGVLNVGSDAYPINQGVNQIGRHPTCSIVINDPTVSKKHAEIEANNHETSAWICDLNSSNKTKLNNSVLRPRRCYELKDGNLLEFGVVRAVYKVCRSMDESLIPETPTLSRQKKQQFIIPGTPDSSNNSSTMDENVSVIPGTQADDKSAFRYPTLPLRTSTSNTRRSSIQDSSVDDLDNSRSTNADKRQNVGEQRISIHDMETQKSFESADETNTDIHDIETQKICLKSIKVHAESLDKQKVNIHNMETQREPDLEGKVTDIHDVETQHDIDIHDMKTPKKINVQNVTSRHYGTPSSMKPESKFEDGDKSMKEEKDSANNAMKQTTKFENESNEKNLQKNFLRCSQSSVVTDCEVDLSELDRSRNLLGSQNLLDDFSDDDELSDEKLKSTSVNTSCANEDNDEDNDKDNEKSNDYENIFDAATQINEIDKNASTVVTKRIDFSFKTSLTVNDSDETDSESVFQKYSFNVGKDNERSSQSRMSDSDDSTTDEEGHFTEIALKEKRAASCSFEKLQNLSKEVKNNISSSKDSEDLFDMLTQPINQKTKKSLSKEDNEDEIEVNYDMPTQVIDKYETKNNMKINENSKTKNIDNLAPTQVTKCSIEKTNSSAILPKNKTIPDEDEIEDNTPTQIITITEKPSNIDNDELSDTSDSAKVNAVDESNVENIDYEMAPTQRISDIVEQKSVLSTSKNKILSKKSLSEVNLDDTLERNLNAMFEDVNEEGIEDRSQISTQVLENILQSSPREDSPGSSKAQKSIKGRKSKIIKPTSIADSTLNLVPNQKSSKSSIKNVNNDKNSSSTENVENTSNEQTEKTSLESNSVTVLSASKSIPEDPSTSNDISKNPLTPKSAPKNSSTPKSLRKKKQEESKTIETTQGETVTNDKNECAKNLNTQAAGSSVDGEHVEQTSKELDDNDDILAGLPEVKISGTLSNPPSPTSSTSSEYKININNNTEKQISVRIAPKKKTASRKSLRKTVARKKTENAEPYHSVSKSNSTTILGSSSNSFSNNFDVDKVSVHKNEKINSSNGSVRKATSRNSRRSKDNDFFLEPKSIASIDSQRSTRQSSSIRGNGRTRNSSKENADRSSVFQVEKEDVFQKSAVDSTKKNILNTSRIGKRSVSMTDAIEINNPKKRKDDINEGTAAATRGRQRNTNTIRRQSANILDFVTKKNSSVADINDSCSRIVSPNRISADKEAIIKIVRICPQTGSASPNTPASSISPSAPKELNVEDSINKKTRQSQRINTTKNQVVSSIIKKSANQRPTNKGESLGEDISSQIGEESQEIEMIMNGSLKEQSTGLNREVEKNVRKSIKNTKTRNTRKRGNTNVHTDIDNTDNISASSISYESDNAYFEAPISKAKRAKISKNTSSKINTTINESIKSTNETKRSKRSTRSTRSNQESITDSSVEESIEIMANQTSLHNNTSRTNNTRGKRQKKVENVERNKKQTKTIIEETPSSEMNSSNEPASIPSTPRTRYTLSSSFTSPFKMRHRILFTGISSNDYSKLLTKLGASQVEDPAKCTVLVTDKVRRTVKFLCALALSVPIVSVTWLVDSEKAGHFVELEGYTLKDPAAEATFRFNLEESLEKAKEHKLLEGYTLILTRNVAPPPLPDLKSMITSCGGRVLLRPPPAWPQKTVIISRKEDLTNAKKFLAKAPKIITVQSTEFILTGILRQELEFTEFKLI